MSTTAHKMGIVGDTHLASAEKYGRHSTKLNMNTRTADKLTILRDVVADFLKEKVDCVVFLGDIFETITPSERLRSAFVDCIAPLARNNITSYIILGNHDTNLRQLHSFLTIDALNIDLIQVVSELTCCTMENSMVGLVPCGEERALLDDIKLKKEKDVSYDYVLGHMALKPHFRDGIIEATDLASMVGMLINGHWHHKDEHHLGSVCVYRRDEIDKVHAYGILDLDTCTLEHRPVNDRKFVKMDMDVSTIEEMLDRGIEEKSKDYIVSLKIKDTPHNLAMVSKRSIRALFPNALKVVIEQEQTTGDKKVFHEIRKEFVDLSEDIENYCKHKESPDMLQPGKDIIDEVKRSDSNKSVLI